MGNAKSAPEQCPPQQSPPETPEILEPKRKHASEKPYPTIAKISLEDAQIPAIIIADIHLGRNKDDYRQALNDFIYQLNSQIQKTGAKTIFILGDMFQRGKYRVIDDWITLFTKLEELRIKTHVIPGNHDRKYVSKLPSKWTGGFVVFHPEPLLHFHNYYLGHDILRAGVGSKSFASRNWLKSIRGYYPGLIPDDITLILGHLHERSSADNEMTLTIPPFSPEIHIFGYCLLLENESGQVIHEFKRFFG